MAKIYQLPKLYHPDFAIPNVKPKGPVEIDDNNKIVASNLIDALWVRPAGLELRDLKGKYTSPIFNTSTIVADYLSWTGETTGRGLEYDQRLGAEGDRTIFVRFRSAYKASYLAPLLSIRTSTSPFDQINLMINGWWSVGASPTNSSGAISIFAIATAAGNHAIGYTGTSAFIENGWNTVAAVLREGDALELYLNGQQLSITTTNVFVPSFSHADDQHTSLGGFGDLASLNVLDGDIESAGILSTALSPALAEELTRNVYQLTKPAIPLTYFVPAAAPAGGNEPLFYHHQRMLSRCS